MEHWSRTLELGYLCMRITALGFSRVSFTPVRVVGTRNASASALQVVEIRVNPGDEYEIYEDMNHQVTQSIPLDVAMTMLCVVVSDSQLSQAFLLWFVKKWVRPRNETTLTCLVLQYSHLT